MLSSISIAPLSQAGIFLFTNHPNVLHKCVGTDYDLISALLGFRKTVLPIDVFKG